ncbi:hypothetical protein [Acidovorax sp. Leaf160]|uniref:hypothetical protein n=1 Tax=Acidovorax sp. Leaf160 TaxID=1736280 RepID=UPI0006FEC01D|nr:hypothetical protein [Acidovorax sp. Leaf160]KQR41389.1 cell surface protein [Acidovorax sp. Leaf160]
MKKNVLALSIAAMIGGLGLAGTASADVIRTGGGLTAANATTLRISDAGVGHNLLVPYFNAQNNNMSVFHVVNTDTSNGKAVKVRFRSASNSDDILDFQLFLSPGDVWTAAVTQGSDGVAQITTADNSCTVPALTKNVPQRFVTDRLNSSLVASDKANQTREGYVELFSMADIPVNTTGTAAAPTLYQAIKHVNGVAPCSVAGSAARTLLDRVASTNYTAANVGTSGFNTPTTGLMGDWYILNIPQTTTFSGASTSVVAVDGAGNAARGNFVHFPQLSTPVGNVDRYTADPLFRTDARPANGSDYGTTAVSQVLKAAFYDLPDMSTPYVAVDATAATSPLTQAAELTRALAATSITNQYATDAAITAKTDWVFSMPTRRYSVAANYAAGLNGANYRLFSRLATGTTGVTAIDWFRPGNTSVDSVGNICVASDGQTFLDREEGGQPGQGPIFSPGTPTAGFAFCGETSVLAFKDSGASVLGGNVARQTLTSGFAENGWGVMDTTNGGPGLPVLGSSFQKLTNGSVANGVSGNFGITWPHRFTRFVAPVQE